MKKRGSGEKDYYFTQSVIIGFSLPIESRVLTKLTGEEITYQGSSMFPIFIEGDRLIFEKNSRIRSGDVIVYAEPGGLRYIIHRVITIRGDQMIQTAGDNNRAPDPYILDPALVLGKVIRRNRLIYSTPVRGGIHGLVLYQYPKSVDL
ncbi:MAG: signal peptidase I [Methanobacteriota archaeon]